MIINSKVFDGSTLPTIKHSQLINNYLSGLFTCYCEDKTCNLPILVYNGNLFMFENDIDKNIEYDKLNVNESVYDVARNQRERINHLNAIAEKEKESKRLYIEAEERKRKYLEEAKKKSEQLKNKSLPSCVDRAFDLSVINLDCNYPIDKIIEGVVNFADQLKRNENKVKNVCILFSGYSGTGKSEFAKYLASMADLGFTHIRASDLFNKYVGETEKSISILFKNASQTKNVLLIDEADSLLRDRNLANHGWETTQVNEFLCRMEEYEGILICSSNLINNFDKAAMRRFVFKIKFLGLTDDGKITLCKKYLNEVCLLPSDLSLIKNINDLRPGDFKAVRDRLLVVYRDRVSFEEAVEELKLETSYRQRENVVATL